MRRFLVPTIMLAVWLTSCAAKPVSYRSGLTELKRELNHAQIELSNAQSRVMKLEEAIAQKEIKRIEEQIGKIGEGEMIALLHSREQRLAFFSDQRETLSTIIHNHPVCAIRAQDVLDQILTLITHISDEVID